MWVSVCLYVRVSVLFFVHMLVHRCTDCEWYASFWSVSSCTIITPALTMCAHMYSTTLVYTCVSVYVCAHAFQACSVRAPACFQYSLLLGGDYPACIWLLSAFDWKLERPGAPWEERSENFLNPAFTPPLLNSRVPLNLSRNTLYSHCFFFFYKQ